MSESNNIRDNRRSFFAALGATGVGLAIASRANAATVGPWTPSQRRDRAFDLRVDQARANRDQNPSVPQQTNGDEETLANQIGSYTKGLPHNGDGEVDLTAYRALVRALSTGDSSAFETITLGGQQKLTNPQGGLAFQLEGGDNLSFSVPPPPQFSSNEEAAELAENYWMALLRDTPFSEYSTSAVAHAAAEDLTIFGEAARVPKDSDGEVTTRHLFRGLTPGDQSGPYVSQFFYQTCPFGMNDVRQLVRSPLAGVDFMTTHDAWLAIQNGARPNSRLEFEATPRYMRNGRALGEWVHIDVLFQAYFMSFLVLAGLGAPIDAGDPYVGSRTQIGFVTYGGPHIATLLCEVSTRALAATWYQKWFAHRRLRPEAFAGAAHTRLYRRGSAGRFPVHEELLASLQTTSRLGGYLPAANALLPMAFPEGSPTHPAYTAGHATVAGACTTILKAFFDESWIIPNPVQPSPDGLTLIRYEGDLRVGDELNKVASNVALGRNMAGVHWRSDATESLLLGEAVAVQLMREHKQTFNERANLSLTTFGGERITI